MELNPNHPVTMESRDQWHKIVAILMLKFGVTEVEITVDDVMGLAERLDGTCVVLHPVGKKMFVRLVSMEEGQRLAREAGGT